MSRPARLTRVLETEVQRLKAENQRLVDECIRLGLEIAISEEEDRFKRALLPAAGPNLRIPIPDHTPFKQD
jgi:hypothetical protein